jgi:hypothetical protein
LKIIHYTNGGWDYSFDADKIAFIGANPDCRSSSVEFDNGIKRDIPIEYDLLLAKIDWAEDESEAEIEEEEKHSEALLAIGRSLGHTNEEMKSWSRDYLMWQCRSDIRSTVVPERESKTAGKDTKKG